MAQTSKRSTKKPVKFEQALEQLEQLIEQIETGQISLEDALKHYEKGMTLVKQCRQILAAAEKKIAELTLDDHGRLKVQNSE